MGAGDWVLMVVFWVVLVSVIVWVIARLFPTRTDARRDAGDASDTPRELLDRRLARGEIDTPTYDALRAKLDPRPIAGRS
ncbi:MAG TPA: hypothetical protein VMV16_02460 [Solirubrobacteraceae bacterium]|nr:hypothetical protein [Solirubrobacteraceae bacterium]